MKSPALFALWFFLHLATPNLFADPATKEAFCSVCRVHEGETEAEPVLATANFGGETHGFCSTDCRDSFLEAPEAYLQPRFPRPAPSFEVLDLEGTKLSSDQLRGQTVLLDFWATWCQPCVKDLPNLTRLHQRLNKQGLTVLSVSIDEGEDASRKVARIVKKTKAAHPVYLDSTESPAWSAYLVRVVPTQFLIDGEGNVVAQWSGKIDLEVVEEEILRLLGPETADP